MQRLKRRCMQDNNRNRLDLHSTMQRLKPFIFRIVFDKTSIYIPLCKD